MVSGTLLLDYTISFICRIDVLHCYNAVYVARFFRGFFLYSISSPSRGDQKKHALRSLSSPNAVNFFFFLNIISSFSLVSLVETVKETTGSSF